MAEDVEKQINELRSRLDRLVISPVASALLSNIAYGTRTASQQAMAILRFRLQRLRAPVRHKPVSSLLIAAATGFLFSRLRT